MLEAVIIASIMLSAVAFVATFDTPPVPHASSRASLAKKSSDALSVLYDTPASGTAGDNMLSVLLMECMQGSCANLSTRLSNLLPEGAAYAVYLSNGHQTYPVLVTREPGGEAITSVQPLEPSWSWNFLSTATDLVDPAKEPLLVYSLPLFNSNPVSMGGSPLLVRVHGVRASDGADYVMTSFASTVAGSADGPPLSAASLYFVGVDGKPTASLDIRPYMTKGNATLRLRVNESAGVPLAPGLELAVHVPRGWTARSNATQNAGVWTALDAATDPSGSYGATTVRARLANELRNGTVDFLLDVTYHEDVLDYYPFQAQLSRGAQSVAELLLRADYNSGEREYAAPSVHVGAPRPMGRAAETTWTLAAFIPQDDTTTSNDDSIILTRVEIIEQDGAPIFGDVGPIGGMTGTWTSTGDRLTWTPTGAGSRLSYSTPLKLAFTVNASGVAGAPADRGAFTSPVTFDAWTGQLVRQIGPGLFRGEFLPANGTYGGYNPDTGALSKSHALSSSAVYRSTALPGSTGYASGAASQVADSLYGSYVSVEKRRVPVGGEVAISSNVQSLLFALAEVGQQAGVTLRFYPPWSGDARVPIYEQVNLDQGLLSGQVTQIALVDMDRDGFPDPVLGTENGRVIALHGLTGLRLQGDVWTAPLNVDVQGAGGSTRINRLEPIRLGGEDYIAVGTDANSLGIFVLNRSLGTVWSYETTDLSVVSLDTSTDVDGDGRRDVVAGMVNTAGSQQSTDDSYVLVLRALEGEPYLVPYAPNAAMGFPDAFYTSTGTPSALLGLSGVGPRGTGSGVAVTIQTLVDGGVRVYNDPSNPTITTIEPVPLSTPRAGLQAVDAQGQRTSTLFGSPVTMARPYDYDRDAVTDVLAAGPAGYVFMVNGTVMTQPLYSYLRVGSSMIIDADTRSSVESYTLSSEGEITFTDDAWQTTYYASSALIPTARAISSPRLSEVWAVGVGGSIWKSIPSPLPSVLSQPNYLDGIEMVPHVPTVSKASVVVDWRAYAANLTDVWFRGDVGWIVGEACAACDEPLVMNTTDGGATWNLASHLDGSLADADGNPISTTRLNAIKFHGGYGWIAGDDGLLLRFSEGQWRPVPTSTSADLMDVSCDPNAPDLCVAVGEAGALVHVVAARTPTPVATPAPIQLTQGTLTRDLFSVGVVNATHAYVGSANMILATFDGGQSWTTLPMNYLENDGRVVNVNPDGSGYVYGGTAANGRIWFLHDYATESWAMTTSYADRFPADARIYRVTPVHSNVTMGISSASVSATTNGSEWKSMGTFKPPGPLELTADKRDYRLDAVSFNGPSGRDLRFLINLTTPGDSTLSSPHVRGLTFLVHYYTASAPAGTWQELELDFSDASEFDPSSSTAIWNTEAREVHMPFVREFWTRNVSGEVLDVRSGFDVTGDGRADAWVGTGDVLAINSPDYLIYAGSDEMQSLRPDNRVYLLDGGHGGVVAMTDAFGGKVTHVRVSDADGDLVPEAVFATVWNAGTRTGEVVSLDPLTLEIQWRQILAGEDPQDLEAGVVRGPYGSAVVGTAGTLLQTVQGSVQVERTGFVLALNETDGQVIWRILPEEMGKHYVTKEIPPEWLFGAYVVEVEVEWRDVVTRGQASESLLRSARFYDYFMVTPPDALSPPSPVYNVHLVTWFPDWG